MRQFRNDIILACDGIKTDALFERVRCPSKISVPGVRWGPLPIIDRKHRSRIIPGFLRVEECRLRLQWPWYQSWVNCIGFPGSFFSGVELWELECKAKKSPSSPAHKSSSHRDRQQYARFHNGWERLRANIDPLLA